MNDSANETFTSIWDAIADTPAETVNLKLRSELMEQILSIVIKRGWTQQEAAIHCRVTSPRMNELLRGRISCFSLDTLINIATAIGLRIQVNFSVCDWDGTLSESFPHSSQE